MPIHPSLIESKLAKPYNPAPSRWSKLQTIRAHTDEVKRQASLLQLPQSLYQILLQACEYHDYGKSFEGFSRNMWKESWTNWTRNHNENSHEFIIKVASECGFTIPGARNDFQRYISMRSPGYLEHNIYSLFLIDPSVFSNLDEYYKVCYAVLNHHDIPRADPNRYGEEDFYYYDNFNNKSRCYCWFQVLDNTTSRKRILNNLLANFSENYETLKNNVLQMVSNKNANDLLWYLKRFDWAASGNYDVLKDIKRQIAIDFTFSSIKNYSFGKDFVDNSDTYVWDGKDKLIYILPPQNLSKGVITEIFKDSLDFQYLLKNDLVGFLEPRPFLNYLKEDIDESDLSVYQYNMNRPITFTTLDEILSFVTEHPKSDLKLSLLSYSKIILHETPNDPNLSALLIEGIKRIESVGGEVLGITKKTSKFFDQKLKLIPTVNKKEKTFPEVFASVHNKRFPKNQSDCENLMALSFLKSVVEKSFISLNEVFEGKTLFILDTIDDAIQLYFTLTNDKILETFKRTSDLNFNYDNVKIKLIHPRMKKNILERRIRDLIKFGKSKDTPGEVWIATDFINDIKLDVDYFFTEISDVHTLSKRFDIISKDDCSEEHISKTECFIFDSSDYNTNNLTKAVLKSLPPLFSPSDFYECIETEHKKLIPAGKDITTKEEELILKSAEELNGYKFKKEYLKDHVIDDGLQESNIHFKDQFKQYQDFLGNGLTYNIIPEKIYRKNKKNIDQLKILVSSPENSVIERSKYEKELSKYSVKIGFNDLPIEHRHSLREEFPVIAVDYSDYYGVNHKVT